jgi:hypothetical protein
MDEAPASSSQVLAWLAVALGRAATIPQPLNCVNVGIRQLKAKEKGGKAPAFPISGDKGIRTPDLTGAIRARYQLRYVPTVQTIRSKSL